MGLYTKLASDISEVDVIIAGGKADSYYLLAVLHRTPMLTTFYY